VVACALGLVFVAGGTAGGSQTPGRVVLPLGPAAATTSTETRVGPVCADALSDGRALIAARADDGSLSTLRLLPSGAPDVAFGSSGSVTLTNAALTGTEPIGVVALGDGSVYVVVKIAQELDNQPISVVHVLADGSLDPGYGQGGVARTPAIARPASAGWCVPVIAAQPDRKLILCSADGRTVRLLTDGSEDPSFHAPVAPSGFSRTAIAVLADGRIAVNEGVDRLLVLSPDGSPDPRFNGGSPLTTVRTSALVARGDGSIDVFGNGAEHISSTGTMLTHYQAGGDVAIAEPDGGALVLAGLFRSGVELRRFDASLSIQRSATYREPRFGGATISAGTVKHVAWAATGSFSSAAFLRHGDGLLVVGHVSVVDTRAMLRHDELGVAALHSDATLDTSFGGPGTPTRIRVKLVPRHPLATDVTVPRAGAVLVQAWDRHHHQLAQGQRAAFAHGTIRVHLKRIAHRVGRVRSYTISYRDLTGINATITKPR